MPNRIIREGILTSKRIALLKYENRWLYLGLLLCADDAGRIEYTSNKLLNAKIFSRDDVKDSDVERWLKCCQAVGLILIYEAKDSHYIQLFDFKQQYRTESKHPAPEKTLLDACIANANQGICTCAANDHLDGDVVLDEDEVLGGDVLGAGAPLPLPVKLRNLGNLTIPEILANTPKFMEAWNKWTDYRKTGAKVKNIDKMFQAQLDKLALYGTDWAIERITRTIENGWTGLFFKDDAPPPAPQPVISEAEKYEIDFDNWTQRKPLRFFSPENIQAWAYKNGHISKNADVKTLLQETLAI